MEKTLSSDEIQEKICQPIAESRIQVNCLLMSSDAIVNIDEQKSADDPGLVSLLMRALNKLANSGKYNGSVEDIYAFVDAFNERDPEYKSRLGQQAILYNAEKQMARGWK
jgi:hypothetical protein